jgi:hypothetical protein
LPKKAGGIVARLLVYVMLLAPVLAVTTQPKPKSDTRGASELERSWIIE